MIAGVPKESYAGERRVALVPGNLPALQKLGIEVLLEAGAGAAAGFSDAAYLEKGGKLAASRQALFAAADLVLRVRALSGAAGDELALVKKDQVLIGLLEPLAAPQGIARLARRGATAFALELVPRITRAQSMDVLSSMATVAGYKAVLLAADALPRMFPLMMTAGGTITPARVAASTSMLSTPTPARTARRSFLPAAMCRASMRLLERTTTAS